MSRQNGDQPRDADGNHTRKRRPYASGRGKAVVVIPVEKKQDDPETELPHEERERRWAFYTHITHGRLTVDRASDLSGVSAALGYEWLAWCRNQYARMLPNRQAQLADARDGCSHAIEELRVRIVALEMRRNFNAAIGYRNIMAHYEEMVFKLDNVLATEQGMNVTLQQNNLEVNFGSLPADVQKKMAEAMMKALG